jgi:peptidylprolyl isomerase
MASKRQRERKAQREQAAQKQQRTLIIAGGVILVLVLIFAVIQISSNQPGARLPRASRVSAAGLNKGDGADICSRFPGYTGAETQPPALVVDKNKDYAAWIVTDKGEIAIDLYAEVAPQTVNNFMFLACNHFYDGLTFHRVLPGFMAQGGDPKGDGTGGPPYTIPDEFKLSDLKFDKAGQLSMAHTSAPDSAGSQFFITYAAATQLNGAFTVFGQVVKGMEFVQAITPRDPSNPSDASIIPDKMTTIIVRQVGPK